MNTEKGTEPTGQKKTGQHNTALTGAIWALLLAGTMGVAIAAQDITAAEADQINAMLAPVANPEANVEKVDSVPEDPAAVVGTRFSYQGTLRLSGDRAQGLFDFRFKLIAGNGSQLGSTLVRSDLNVIDGLFATELDFGESPIDGDDLFLEIQVRDGASTGAYTILLPRQRINATPYAVRALHGGDAAGGSSPWTVAGSAISYTGGNVGIGTASPGTRLMVKSNNAQTAVFDTGNNGYISFWEEGAPRGYIGSFQTGTGSNDTDFEIGTGIPNTTGKMHIVTQGTPRITVLPAGRVGVGMAWPSARLHVGSASSNTEDAFRVSVGTSAKLRVASDGTTHMGGDIQQGLSHNGALKVALNIGNCGSTSLNAFVRRQFNTINGGVATAENTAAGECIISLPFVRTDRFWMAQALPSIFGGTPRAVASCRGGPTTSKLRCEVWKGKNDDPYNAHLMLMIY